MIGICKATLLGEVVYNAEYKDIASGLCTFILTATEGKGSIIAQVEVWGKKAEQYAQELKRGAVVCVDGSIYVDNYTKNVHVKLTTNNVAIIKPAPQQGDAWNLEYLEKEATF